MAANDTSIEELNKTLNEAAEHIGDLYEGQDKLRSDLDTLSGSDAGQTLADLNAALENATTAAEAAALSAQISTALSNEALAAAQSITDEANVIIAQVLQSDIEPNESSFFDQAETIAVAPVIAVEQSNNVAGFYRLVRDFVIRAKPWTEAIRYFTSPDEMHDLTLISRRVYGYSDEYIAIMAAADLDSVENTLEPQTLVLPTPAKLHSLKRIAGYKNTDKMRLS